MACALLLLAARGSEARAAVAHLCGPVLPGFAHCDAEVVKRSSAKAAAATTAVSYGPGDIQAAYGLSAVAADYGADQTVAVVDAYDLPSAETDLATYRARYGLPPCTTANGCFRKVDQGGGTSYPAYDPNWAGEIALDIEAVSAVCPHCRILLVEANSTQLTDMAAAVQRAAAMGATQISNSYGGSEWRDETLLEPVYHHAGVAITASSGDSGYGVEYPAASRYVTAVGGTSLQRDASTPRGWSETVWNGTGSGCSEYIPKPSWQSDIDCANRTVADVSAVADPYTGLRVYDSADGWTVTAGGTSLAAPVVAAAYALTGSAAASGSFAYDHRDWFNDVTSGSNDLGNGSCTFNYLCNAGVGFDGPTGIGTPNSAHPSGPPPPADTGTPSSDAPSGSSSSATSTPVAPAAPAPAPVAGPVRSSIAISTAARTATRSGRLSVRLTCGRAAACTGTLRYQFRLRRGRLLTLGTRRYSIGAGRSATVTVALSRKGRRLLARKRKLRLYATAHDSDGTTAQASFIARAPKPR